MTKTTKTTRVKARKHDASNDAAFMKLSNQWKEAERACNDTSDHADAIRAREEAKLPKPPDIAIGLGHWSNLLLFSALQDRLDGIRKRAADFLKKYPNDRPRRLYNGVALNPREGNEVAAIQRLLPELRKRAKAEHEVNNHPDVKAARKAAREADQRERRLFNRLVNTPATTPAGLLAKLEVTAQNMRDCDDPPNDGDNSDKVWDQRACFSVVRDLRRLAGEARHG